MGTNLFLIAKTDKMNTTEIYAEIFAETDELIFKLHKAIQKVIYCKPSENVENNYYTESYGEQLSWFDKKTSKTTNFNFNHLYQHNTSNKEINMQYATRP